MNFLSNHRTYIANVAAILATISAIANGQISWQTGLIALFMSIGQIFQRIATANIPLVTGGESVPNATFSTPSASTTSNSTQVVVKSVVK